MNDPSLPELIPETLLKKRRSLEELALRRQLSAAKGSNKRRKVVRGENIRIKRPEEFVKEYRIREGSENKIKRVKRETERNVKSKVSVKDTVGFVVRAQAAKHCSKETKLALKNFGLPNQYDAVFMKLTKEKIAALKPYDSYIAYGFVSRKSVDELLHRHAFTMIDGIKMPLSDNITIEKVLGEKDILCLNDLSQAIFATKESFEDALNVLCTFSLAAPFSKFEKTILSLHETLERKRGFLGDEMEDFLRKVL